jgi:hypothetical protein
MLPAELLCSTKLVHVTLTIGQVRKKKKEKRKKLEKEIQKQQGRFGRALVARSSHWHRRCRVW